MSNSFRDKRQIQPPSAYKRTWLQGIKERVFMLLDYDPTDVQSGETEEPTVVSAVAQWLYRVVWTRKIEIGGFVLLVVVGMYCYSAVVESKKQTNDGSERQMMSSSVSSPVEFQPERTNVVNYQR